MLTIKVGNNCARKEDADVTAFPAGGLTHSRLLIRSFLVGKFMVGDFRILGDEGTRSRAGWIFGRVPLTPFSETVSISGNIVLLLLSYTLRVAYYLRKPGMTSQDKGIVKMTTLKMVIQDYFLSNYSFLTIDVC